MHHKTLFVVLVLVLTTSAAYGQTYRAGDALGEFLSKTRTLAQPGNAGGKNILENSCIFKNSFSISASEIFLDQCNLSEAISKFTAKYGQPDQVSTAPGGKTVLEYFLLFKENQYHIKFFFGCTEAKTELFAMVECGLEKNRVMPGGKPGEKPMRSGKTP